MISCPLCKSKILWNISVILGRNVEQDQTMCYVQDVLRTRMTTLPFLLFELSPFVEFYNDNPLISYPFYKSKTLWNIFMILGRNVEDVTRTRMTTLPFLPLALSPIVMSDPRRCMKVGSLLYENTCSEWLHVVYSKYGRL